MPFKILVVEDTLDTRELLHFFLTTKGFSVSMAGDGQEGLYLAKAEKPDLIISDLTMPTMDGVEFVRQLQADPEIAPIPIVIYTAFGTEKDTEVIEAGAKKVFHKPFDIDEMLEEITGLLKPANDR